MTERFSNTPQTRGGLRFSSRKLLVSIFFLFVLPATVAYAGFFALLDQLFATEPFTPARTFNSQNTTLFASADMGHTDTAHTVVAESLSSGVVGSSALYAESGPEGAMADVVTEGADNGQISLYIVRSGDSYASIAKMFDVSVNTILWANNLSRGAALKVGQELAILPVSGVQHMVKKGDTVASIAKKYKGDPEEIARYNGLSITDKLEVGDTVIVPDGEVPATPKPHVVSATSKLRGTSGPAYDGYYAPPLTNYRKTQGLHGYNGVDLASYLGAPVMASAEGDVIIARQGGYNGGYGSYVVIAHPNGTQTLYGHLQSVSVSAGWHVLQGQVIGAQGNTGRSTGTHLHFEVRGAKNPF